MEWILVIAIVFLGIGLYAHRAAIGRLADRLDDVEEKMEIKEESL